MISLYVDFGDDTGVNLCGALNQNADSAIEKVQIGNYYISNTAINQLVQDMTAYAAENGISLNYVEDVKNSAELMNLVNAAWSATA